jgi:hypothetical protein
MKTSGAAPVLASLALAFALPARGAETLAAPVGCTSLVASAQPASPWAANGKISAVKTLNVGFTARLVPVLPFDVPKVGLLTITTPNGYVYQETEVPIGSRDKAGNGEKARRLPGHPFPVAVVEPGIDTRRGAEPGAALLPLPPLLVGGTSIQHGGLYGTWKAEFSPGDGSRSCSVKFVITQ